MSGHHISDCAMDIGAMQTLRQIVQEVDPGGPPLWRRSQAEVLAVVQRWLDLGWLKKCELTTDRFPAVASTQVAPSPEVQVLMSLHEHVASLPWQGQEWRFVQAAQWREMPDQSLFKVISSERAREVLEVMSTAGGASPIPTALLERALPLLHDTRRPLQGQRLLLLQRRQREATTARPLQPAYTPAQLVHELAAAKAMAAARAPVSNAGVARRTHWIEVELMHEDRSPAPGHVCEICPPTGEPYRATTDKNGLVRWEGDSSGGCKVRFPGLDGGTWKPAFPVRPDTPRVAHVVQQGECLSRVAWSYGFVNWRVVYQHPSNAELRKQRPNPDVLHPGDVVNIPARDDKAWSGPTDKRYVFKLRDPIRPLRIVLLDEDRAPMVDEPCTAQVGEVLLYGCTDDQGVLSLDLPVDATDIELWVAGARRRLSLGAFNPMDNVDDHGVSGVQARLQALGFQPGPSDGLLGVRTRAALVAFQRHHRLPRTGQADADTRARLSAEVKA